SYGDWSSDVCTSDLAVAVHEFPGPQAALDAAVLVPDNEEVLQRPDPVVLAEPPVVAAALAGQEVADLGIGAVVVQVAAARGGGQIGRASCREGVGGA